MISVRHIGVVVKDLERALYFYCDLLGFKIVKKMEEHGEFIDKILGLKEVRVTTVKMTADDGNLIELLYYHLPPKPNNRRNEICAFGLSHIALTVEDINAEYKRLSESGVKFNSSVQKSPDGYAKVAICRDPEDNFIELVEVL